VKKLSFNPGVLAKIPKTCILSIKSVFVFVGEIAKGKIMAGIREDNLAYLETPSDHTPMISMSDKHIELL
jgi:hypothetical protein